MKIKTTVKKRPDEITVKWGDYEVRLEPDGDITITRYSGWLARIIRIDKKNLTNLIEALNKIKRGG